MLFLIENSAGNVQNKCPSGRMRADKSTLSHGFAEGAFDSYVSSARAYCAVAGAGGSLPGVAGVSVGTAVPFCSEGEGLVGAGCSD